MYKHMFDVKIQKCIEMYNRYHIPLYSLSVATNFGVSFPRLLFYACKMGGWVGGYSRQVGK